MAELIQPIAVVTGGAGGIGAVTAERLADRGCAVAIFDLDSSGQDVANHLVRQGKQARFYRCDLTDRAEVNKCGAAVVEELGSVSVLVNNAGWTPHERFLDQSPDVWKKIVAINFDAVLNTCHTFARDLSEPRAIVNVASDAARVGVPDEAVYAGAKAAVIAFSKSLAVELGRTGVRVNVVSPGSTRTALLEGMYSEEQLAAKARATPLKKLAAPEDIAGAVCYLAFDATHVTGQVLSINGGMTRV
jgi:2-hydroxycyclohexanecarboxyl-CoA dehydrogenase